MARMANPGRQRLPNINAQLIQIYNLYRNALMNQLYYARRLDELQRRNLVSEVLLSIGTGSFGTLAVFRGDVGRHVFLYLAALSAFLSILRPILQWPKKIEQYSQLFVGYSDLYFDIQRIVQEVTAYEYLADEQVKVFNQARERFRKLSLRDEPVPSKRKLAACKAEVLIRIPAKTLWMARMPTAQVPQTLPPQVLNNL